MVPVEPVYAASLDTTTQVSLELVFDNVELEALRAPAVFDFMVQSIRKSLPLEPSALTVSIASRKSSPEEVGNVTSLRRLFASGVVVTVAATYPTFSQAVDLIYIVRTNPSQFAAELLTVLVDSDPSPNRVFHEVWITQVVLDVVPVVPAPVAIDGVSATDTPSVWQLCATALGSIAGTVLLLYVAAWVKRRCKRMYSSHKVVPLSVADLQGVQVQPSAAVGMSGPDSPAASTASHHSVSPSGGSDCVEPSSERAHAFARRDLASTTSPPRLVFTSSGAHQQLAATSAPGMDVRPCEVHDHWTPRAQGEPFIPPTEPALFKREVLPAFHSASECIATSVDAEQPTNDDGAVCDVDYVAVLVSAPPACQHVSVVSVADTSNDAVWVAEAPCDEKFVHLPTLNTAFPQSSELTTQSLSAPPAYQPVSAVLPLSFSRAHSPSTPGHLSHLESISVLGHDSFALDSPRTNVDAHILEESQRLPATSTRMPDDTGHHDGTISSIASNFGWQPFEKVGAEDSSGRSQADRTLAATADAILEELTCVSTEPSRRFSYRYEEEIAAVPAVSRFQFNPGQEPVRLGFSHHPLEVNDIAGAPPLPHIGVRDLLQLLHMEYARDPGDYIAGGFNLGVHPTERRMQSRRSSHTTNPLQSPRLATAVSSGVLGPHPGTSSTTPSHLRQNGRGTRLPVPLVRKAWG